MATNTMIFVGRQLFGFLGRRFACPSAESSFVCRNGGPSNKVMLRGFCGCLHPRKQFLSLSGVLHRISTSSASTCTFSTITKKVSPNMQLKTLPHVGSVRFLPTLNQIRRNKPRTKNTQPKKYIPRAEKILLGPQRKGVCVKVFVRKPKKPNSAQRKCALLRLSSGKTITAYIPGQKGQLQEHGVVLFEGGRVQDCPGIQYKIIRGKLDMN